MPFCWSRILGCGKPGANQRPAALESGNAMSVFIFAGSKGGSARTISSILLAAGLRELGFSPVHVQLVPDGTPPFLGRIDGLPFAVVWTRSSDMNTVYVVLEASSSRGAAHSHVIIDTPAQPIRKALAYAAGTRARILLPMRDGVQEIERFIHDLHEIQEEASASDESLPRAWIVPVGWPSSLRPKDYADILSRRGLKPGPVPALSVIHPGVPSLDPLDLDFRDDANRFTLTEQQQDAAIRLAEAVLRANDETPSIRFPYGT